MRTAIQLATAIVVLSGVLPSILHGVNGTQEPGKITVSYDAEQTWLTLHEPVILNLTIDNGLSRSIKVNLGKDFKENFLISVSRPDGSTINVQQTRKEGIGLIGISSIASGQQYKQTLLLNEWLDFNAPGRYEVEVKLSGIDRENSPINVVGNKVLVSSLRNRSDDTAIFARLALGRIESRTQDPALKESIRRALSNPI